MKDEGSRRWGEPAGASEKTRGCGDWWLQQTLRNPSPHFPSAPLLSPQINTLVVSIPDAVVSLFVGCHVCFQGQTHAHTGATHSLHIQCYPAMKVYWVLRGASIKVSICGVKGGVLPNPHPPSTDPAPSKWGQQATCASGTGTQTDRGQGRRSEVAELPLQGCTCSPSTLDAAIALVS